MNREGAPRILQLVFTVLDALSLFILGCHGGNVSLYNFSANFHFEKNEHQ